MTSDLARRAATRTRDGHHVNRSATIALADAALDYLLACERLGEIRVADAPLWDGPLHDQPRRVVRQPRERAVPCRRCGKPTWSVNAVCDRHGAREA